MVNGTENSDQPCEIKMTMWFTKICEMADDLLYEMFEWRTKREYNYVYLG